MGREASGPAAGFGTSEVARLCGVSASTIRRYVARGWLASTRESGAHRYAWSEVSRMRALLRAPGVAPARIARALRGATTEHRVRLIGGSVVLVDAAGAFDPRTGQSILDLDAVAPSPGASAGALAWVPTWPGFVRARDRGELARAGVLLGLHLRVHPGDALAWVESGKLHVLRGAADRAVESFERALRCEESEAHGPDAAHTWVHLGEALEDLGRDEDAVSAYLRGLDADPELADAHFNASRVYERLGNRWRALQHLAAYRRMRPV